MTAMSSSSLSDLQTLSATVDAASVPDRELDGEVAWAVLGQDWSSGPEKAISEPFPHIKTLPAYTADVGAALQLVERVLPGWRVHLSIGGGPNTADLCLSNAYPERAPVEGATPALALLAALLRALINTEGKTSDV